MVSATPEMASCGLRGKRSATAPMGMPNTSRGVWRRAMASPTMKGESVASRTTHPNATFSPA